MESSNACPTFIGHFPLRDCPADMLERLCRALWEWQDCSQCANNGGCSGTLCPWNERACLEPYLKYYSDITAAYMPEDWVEPKQVLNNHEDLLDVVRFIKDHPERQRETLMSEYFDGFGPMQPLEMDKRRAFNLAFGIISMLPCAEKNHYLRLHPDVAPVTWRNHQTACEVWKVILPFGRKMSEKDLFPMVLKLSASVLRESGIHIVGTDDLRKHLYLDHESPVVYVFRQVGFLKIELKAKRYRGHTSREIIPRQKILDTLRSLYSLLFPRHDLESRAIAKGIDCDIECLDLDIMSYLDDEDEDYQYQYLGTRLEEIVRLVDHKKRLGSWLFRAAFQLRKRIAIILSVIAILVAVIGVIYQAHPGGSYGVRYGESLHNHSAYATGQWRTGLPE